MSYFIKQRIKDCGEPFYHDIIMWVEKSVYENVRTVIRMFK